MTGTCSKDIRVSSCGIQTFTRFHGNIVYCGLISDFSTSLWFLFNEDDFAISNLISVISARAYEISPSVGPLGWGRDYKMVSLPNRLIVTTHPPVRNDRSFKPWRILYKERAYFGMKKKESGEQGESTFTNSATILKNIGYFKWPKEQ